jgi:hypothetical protein
MNPANPLYPSLPMRESEHCPALTNITVYLLLAARNPILYSLVSSREPPEECTRLVRTISAGDFPIKEV